MPIRKVEDGASIVVCSTCRLSAEARDNAAGMRGGEMFFQTVERVAQETCANQARIEVQKMPCLFACSRYCTVHLRAPGKVGYVLGGFSPEESEVEALIDFFLLYRESEEGIVPFAQWPEGIKGHFIVRTPPEGYVLE